MKASCKLSYNPLAPDQARDVYLAYRQQSGYANQGYATFFERVVGLLSQGKAGELQSFFNQLANNPTTEDDLKQLMEIIITVLNGSRDKALGDDSVLYYVDAAEVLFLIERLGG